MGLDGNLIIVRGNAWEVNACLFWERLSAIQPPTQVAFPILDASDKKFDSRLVAPTVFQNQPFGVVAEGLSH
ncbi:hypothetical protein [Fimbriiglobus ruber]|uniref:hypothetical protein n=1 Tax=Fimbriiglobus ruber TaxID=1908690 RepID=UPI0013798ED3|nr:hypothetical protein [Fimbriiglobus ruber]